MFAKRSDGKAVKVDPYTKLPPHIMSKRSDALNFAKVSLRCEGIDEFVKKERARCACFFGRTYFLSTYYHNSKCKSSKIWKILL